MHNCLTLLLVVAAFHNGFCAFPRDFLLATDWRRNDIFAINLEGTQQIPLNLSAKFPSAVAFNPVTREVYWSEYLQHMDRNPSAIGKGKLDSQGKVSELYRMPLMKNRTASSHVKYMTVDHTTGNVWMTYYPPAAIKVADSTLRKSTSIISQNLMMPTGIAVHPRFKMIYFCDLNSLQVESAYMDGQNRKVIVNTETRAYALTIDITGGRLYWLDDDMDGIVTSDLNGRDYRMFVQGTYSFRSIVLDSMYIYYTDTFYRSVQRMERYGKQNQMSMGDFSQGYMYALALHKDNANKDVDSVCTMNNGGCPSAAICLPSAMGYACGVNDMIIRVPGPPMYVQIMSRSSSRVSLYWTPPMVSVSSYLVKYSRVGTADFLEVKVPGNKEMVELVSLVPGSQYDVSVYGVNMDYVMSPNAAMIRFTTDAQGQVQITSGPGDVTTKANMNVMLHCEVSDITNDLDLVWRREDSNMEIYSFRNGRGSLTDSSSDKYEVSITRFRFLLTIRSVQWSEAGTYSCEIRGNSASVVSANLVVFHNLEFLTPTLKEGARGEFGAAGYYGSPKMDRLSPQQIPFLKCYYDGGDLTGTTSSAPGMAGERNTVLRWVTDMTVYAKDHDKNFTCRIGTIRPDFYVDFSTQIQVLYGVRNIRVSPLKDYYSYGDMATCMADGNPMVQYMWTNNKMGMNVRSQTLLLTGSMAKSSWKCMAYNIIDGNMMSTELQHTIRMKDQYCLYGDACRALCKTGTGSDSGDYCCVTFAPCDQCTTGYGPNSCQKTMCSAPSRMYSNGQCDC